MWQSVAADELMPASVASVVPCTSGERDWLLPLCDSGDNVQDKDGNPLPPVYLVAPA